MHNKRQPMYVCLPALATLLRSVQERWRVAWFRLPFCTVWRQATEASSVPAHLFASTKEWWTVAWIWLPFWVPCLDGSNPRNRSFLSTIHSFVSITNAIGTAVGPPMLFNQKILEKISKISRLYLTVFLSALWRPQQRTNDFCCHVFYTFFRSILYIYIVLLSCNCHLCMLRGEIERLENDLPAMPVSTKNSIARLLGVSEVLFPFLLKLLYCSQPQGHHFQRIY